MTFFQRSFYIAPPPDLHSQSEYIPLVLLMCWTTQYGCQLLSDSWMILSILDMLIYSNSYDYLRVGVIQNVGLMCELFWILWVFFATIIGNL